MTVQHFQRNTVYWVIKEISDFIIASNLEGKIKRIEIGKTDKGEYQSQVEW